MKKFLLLVLIAILGTFIYLKIQILGDPNSHFNQTTRFTLGKHEILRTIFGLHSYGDARDWFLSGTTPITVEVVQAQGTSMDEQALNDFLDDIKTYTGRPTLIYNNEQIPAGTLTDANLADVVSKYRRHVLSGEPNLLVIYAEDFARTGDEVAKTYQEYGIVLSDKRLKEVTSRQPAALKQYVESILLHEFGHQLGLEHNSQTDCIMNEQVEKPSAAGNFGGMFTQTQFCDFELQQLNAIKASIN